MVHNTHKFCYEVLDMTVEACGSLVTLAFICFQALDSQSK